MNILPLLKIENLSISFGANSKTLEVLQHISFEIYKGEFIAILGPNGCGKTTLVRTIGGFLKPDSGTVLLNDKNMATPSSDCLLITQDLGLFDWMTAEDNILFGLKAKKVNQIKMHELVSYWIEKLHLSGFEKYYPFELSGGMRQKLAIARALVLDPQVWLMDEPFASLDLLTRQRLQEEFSELIFATGKTTVMITHSIEEAVFLANRVIVLTERPARIRMIAEIDENMPRSSEFILSEKFLRLKNLIWHGMQPEPQLERIQ